MTHPTDLCPRTLRYVTDTVEALLRAKKCHFQEALEHNCPEMAEGFAWQIHALGHIRFRLRRITIRTKGKSQ